MVTQVEWSMLDPMSPDSALFPDGTALHTSPLPEPEEDPRREGAWATILEKFAEVFEKPSSLPPYRSVNGTCKMKEGCKVPPRAGVGKLSAEEIEYTRKLLTDYLEKGWIRPRYSLTAARLFFATKANGSLRSVVDYRALNEVLETQYFPPPEWSNIVNQLGDSKLYSTFDCADFFFQNRLRDEDSWMSAISTCFGQFEWRVCPQALASSPAVAQRLFSGILQSLPCVNSDLTKHPTERRNLLAGNARVFLDDALIHWGDFDEHLAFVYSFLHAMKEQELHLSAPKTQFMRPQCNYLGHVLSAEGVAVQPERVSSLKEWPVPKSTTDVRAFLGFCVYLRRHIEGFGEYAAPLSALTKKGTAFS
jgi:hypothetical protein